MGICNNLFFQWNGHNELVVVVAVVVIVVVIIIIISNFIY